MWLKEGYQESSENQSLGHLYYRWCHRYVDIPKSLWDIVLSSLSISRKLKEMKLINDCQEFLLLYNEPSDSIAPTTTGQVRYQKKHSII